jgi:hypothetical protein
MERLAWRDRAEMMSGSFMVATDPLVGVRLRVRGGSTAYLAARSRWVLPSLREAATESAAVG